MKKIFKNKNFLIGTILVSFLLLIMIISFFYTPYDPVKMDYGNTFKNSSIQHLFGTDNFGRDILSRIMEGTQTAFYVGFFTILIGGIIGIFIGSLAGYFGGIIDEILMRFIDAQMAFPGVLIALIIISIFGTGITNTIIALGIMSIPRFARMTRGGYLQFKEVEFVKAAKARGAGSFRIMYIHILPNIVSSLVVTASLTFASAILAEAGLSYLGLGIQPPTPSWGMMLKDAQNFIYIHPIEIIFPGIMITIMVLGFNFLGDGLRDLLDSKK